MQVSDMKTIQANSDSMHTIRSVSLIRLQRKYTPVLCTLKKGKETKEIDKPGTAENHTRSSQIPLIQGSTSDSNSTHAGVGLQRGS